MQKSNILYAHGDHSDVSRRQYLTDTGDLSECNVKFHHIWTQKDIEKELEREREMRWNKKHKINTPHITEWYHEYDEANNNNNDKIDDGRDKKTNETKRRTKNEALRYTATQKNKYEAQHTGK